MTRRFEEPWLDVDWLADSGIIEVTWKRFANLSQMQLGLDTALGIMQDNGGRKWLANTKGLGVMGQPTQDWINNDWFPRALAGGLRRMAIVLPVKQLAKMNVEDLMAATPKIDLITHYFDDREAALTWLAEVD